jgi:hypothetical protein
MNLRVKRLLLRATLAVLLGPLLLIVLFRFLPVPLTPLMVVRQHRSGARACRGGVRGQSVLP